MGVFREITMVHGGEEYHLTPNNRLLRRIEGELAPSSLTDMIARIGSAKPPVSEVAFVVAELLKAAGADGSDEDEMYGELMSDLMENDGKVFAAMCETLVNIVSPVDAKAGKKGKKQKPQKVKASE